MEGSRERFNRAHQVRGVVSTATDAATLNSRTKGRMFCPTLRDTASTDTTDLRGKARRPVKATVPDPEPQNNIPSSLSHNPGPQTQMKQYQIACSLLLVRDLHVLVRAQIRRITTHVATRPRALIDPTGIPHRRVQKHGLRGVGFVVILACMLPNLHPVDEPQNLGGAPVNGVLVKILRGVEPQLVHLLAVARTLRVHVGLNDALVLAQKLEVDLVLRLVAF